MDFVRKPAVAGMFYPASPSVLESTVLDLLGKNNKSEIFNNIVGIVAPHAGYIYSGGTAAYAYNCVKELDIETVIILSPSHREYFDGVCIFNGEGYATPLGTVFVNKEVKQKLSLNSKIIFEGIQGHRNEHAIEVHIPFLQTIFSNFTIVPIVIGNQSTQNIFELANKLTEVYNEKTLIVASSDLSHFYNKNEANKLDGIIEDKINNFDYLGLQTALNQSKCEACGGGAIVALMKTADLLNHKKAKVLARTDSGDITGDNGEVVGYLSAVVYG